MSGRYWHGTSALPGDLTASSMTRGCIEVTLSALAHSTLPKVIFLISANWAETSNQFQNKSTNYEPCKWTEKVVTYIKYFALTVWEFVGSIIFIPEAVTTTEVRELTGDNTGKRRPHQTMAQRHLCHSTSKQIHVIYMSIKVSNSTRQNIDSTCL